ncbi:glycosyltransferase family 2 protein [Pseudomonas sp. NPDC087346]|uniref:glycosyltransferase family 2 protein n=1 Tax=Pseudomonas sp. NPDC087346 TaxID=3364438 RepID=UPI00382C9CEF
MTNVLVLAANEPHDDKDSGYPLCLTEVDGKPLIQHLSEQCNAIKDSKIILAVREDDCKRWHLDNVVRLLSPEAQVLQIRRKTGGAACTALLAVAEVDNEEPLLILNGNELIDLDFSAIISSFYSSQFDAGVIVFPSVHPRYSYVRINSDNLVVECAEKNPISNNATVGFYWFRHGKDFVSCAKQAILKNAHVDGQYYICPTLNELILRQGRIGVYRIDAQKFHPLKSARQIEKLDHFKETGA